PVVSDRDFGQADRLRDRRLRALLREGQVLLADGGGADGEDQGGQARALRVGHGGLLSKGSAFWLRRRPSQVAGTSAFPAAPSPLWISYARPRAAPRPGCGGRASRPPADRCWRER